MSLLPLDFRASQRLAPLIPDGVVDGETGGVVQIAGWKVASVTKVVAEIRVAPLEVPRIEMAVSRDSGCSLEW